MSVLVFAHRGASKVAPENTLPAFELAYQHGADGIETDVQLTKDNIPVLIHDETINRTTNQVGYVKDYTYHELKQVDAGGWKSAAYTNTIVPTLDDLLIWNQDKQLAINIELKNNKIPYHNLESIVEKKVEQYKMNKQVILSTFNKKSVERLHGMNTSIRYALLTSKRKKNILSFSKENDAAGIHVRYRLLSRRLVQEAKQEGLYIAVYTVNHPVVIKRAIKLGCQILITDVPNIAQKYINE